MTDQPEVVAGAAVLFPAQTLTGSRVLHLAKAQARRKAEPQLVGICPPLAGVPLDLAVRRRWWQRRRRWCPACEAYRDHLRRSAQT